MGEKVPGAKVAIVGAGIFGCSVALRLAADGHRVYLFDKNAAIMNGASRCNQYRLHKGYHYPRSPETGRECRQAMGSFMAKYAHHVIHSRQIYALAREGSKTSPLEYFKFLDSQDLPYRETPPNGSIMTARDKVALHLEVSEGRVLYPSLAWAIYNEIRSSTVTLNLQEKFKPKKRRDFDYVVLAAYARNTELAVKMDCDVPETQFELVEKPIIRMPLRWAAIGLVVMDGAFCSIDPYGTSPYHLLGHVQHAIHETWVGRKYSIPEKYKFCVDQGETKPFFTRFSDMQKAAQDIVPDLAQAKHLTSMFTVRAVLPHVDETDERPTLVRRLDGNVINVFSGKLGTCVEAARQVSELVK